MTDTANNSDFFWSPGEEEQLSAHVQLQRQRTGALVTELEALLEEERGIHDELSAALTESKARREHLKRALEHLTGDTEKYRPKAVKKPAKSGQWDVSDERVEHVLKGFREAGEPLTPSQLARKIGVTHETASKAVVKLRERELIRFVGSVRGGGKQYTPMPEVTDAA